MCHIIIREGNGTLRCSVAILICCSTDNAVHDLPIIPRAPPSSTQRAQHGREQIQKYRKVIETFLIPLENTLCLQHSVAHGKKMTFTLTIVVVGKRSEIIPPGSCAGALSCLRRWFRLETLSGFVVCYFFSNDGNTISQDTGIYQASRTTPVASWEL